MNVKWQSPLSGLDSLAYLGHRSEAPGGYRGYVVRAAESPESWLTFRYDDETESHHCVKESVTQEEARAALERVTHEGHLCEVFVGTHIGHCPERAEVIAYDAGTEGERGVLLCSAHRLRAFRGRVMMRVDEWEANWGAVTHASGPILGDRVRPPMRPVRRGMYTRPPAVWGDDWSGYTLRMRVARDIEAGCLLVCGEGNAWTVVAPFDEDCCRIRTAGPAYFAVEDQAVAVLVPEAETGSPFPRLGGQGADA